MKRLTVFSAVAVGLVAVVGQLAAQDEYQKPSCSLNEGHHNVKSAVTYIKAATEEESPENRERLLADALRNLDEAASGDQNENPAVWYFLGRAYLLMNDGAGADSALRRAEKLQPECAEDIAYHREVLWVNNVNIAVDSINAGALEGAKGPLRAASSVYREKNAAHFYLGMIFADEGETDSAIAYFKGVTEMGDSVPEGAENYLTAIDNIATLYQQLEEWDSAAVWYQREREANPMNTDAMFGLADAYSNMGENDKAIAIYDSILGGTADMKALDLFNAGVKLFNSDQYILAARAFEAGLEQNPYHRDALLNCANTYLAIANDQDRPAAERNEAGQKMEAVARRLVDVDPMNRGSLRLLAASYQMQTRDDSTVAILGRVDALNYEVVVDISRPMNNGYAVMGRVVNLVDTETVYPTITFEFLDPQGTVVTSEAQAGSSLAGKASDRFQFTQEGEIVAWRYKIGS